MARGSSGLRALLNGKDRNVVVKEVDVKGIMTKTNLPVVCNYFYHEEVRKSAKKEKKDE